MEQCESILENASSLHHDEHNEHAQWFVYKTQPRAEFQVENLFIAKGIPTYLPRLERNRKLKSFFPGYLFARIDCNSDQYMRSRSVPGVSYILNSDGVPVPVQEELVEEIRRRVDLKNHVGPAARFTHGDKVAITAGPFSGLDAMFDEVLTPQGRCAILLRILGQMTRVQVNSDHLIKASA